MYGNNLKDEEIESIRGDRGDQASALSTST